MEYQKAFEALVKKQAGQRQTITVNKLYVDFLDDLNSALLLDQLIYWHSRSESEWIHKSYEEWFKEIRLTKNQTGLARKKLEDSGYLQTQIKKQNGSPKLHWKVNFANVSKGLAEYLEGVQKSTSGNQKSRISGNQKSYNNEEDYNKDYNTPLNPPIRRQGQPLFSGEYPKAGDFLFNWYPQTHKEITGTSFKPPNKGEIRQLLISINSSITFLEDEFGESGYVYLKQVTTFYLRKVKEGVGYHYSNPHPKAITGSNFQKILQDWLRENRSIQNSQESPEVKLPDPLEDLPPATPEWQKALEKITEPLDSNIHFWFTALRGKQENGSLYIRSPDDFYVKYVRDNYSELVENAVSEIYGDKQIVWEIEEN